MFATVLHPTSLGKFLRSEETTRDEVALTVTA